jgi:hypothetical protein
MGIVNFTRLFSTFYPALLSPESHGPSLAALAPAVVGAGRRRVAYVEDANVRLMKLRHVLGKPSEGGGVRSPEDTLRELVDAFARQIASRVQQHAPPGGSGDGVGAYVLVFDHPSSVTSLKQRTQALRFRLVAFNRELVAAAEEASLREEAGAAAAAADSVDQPVRHIYAQVAVDGHGRCSLHGRPLETVTVCHLLDVRKSRCKVIELLATKLLEHPLVRDLLRHKPGFQFIVSYERAGEAAIQATVADSEQVRRFRDTVLAKPNFKAELGEADMLCFFWSRVLAEAGAKSGDGKPFDAVVIETIDSDFYLLGLIAALAPWGEKIILFNAGQDRYYSPSRMLQLLPDPDDLRKLLLFFSLSGTDFLERKLVFHRVNAAKLWKACQETEPAKGGQPPAPARASAVANKGETRAYHAEKKSRRDEPPAPRIRLLEHAEFLAHTDHDSFLSIVCKAHGQREQDIEHLRRKDVTADKIQAAHRIWRETIAYWTQIIL